MRNFVLASIFASLCLTFLSCERDIHNYKSIDKLPTIYPDFTNTVIPPNIAPLNFYIREKGIAYFVKISSENGEKIILSGKSPKVEINLKEWRKLLNQNKGKTFKIEVFAKQPDHTWLKYKAIENQIARENIDNYLVYRLINTGYVLWQKMGIYQRNLQDFDETPVFLNSAEDNTCVNCHAFCKNNPSNMSLHIRKLHGGTIVYCNGQLKKINTKTKYTMSAGVYTSWHPSGKYIAFSVNRISQVFTSVKGKNIEVKDDASDIIIYDIDKNMVTTSPKVSTSARENLPTWSPDGKTLYFISAPEAKDAESQIYSKYSLLRIPFDPETNKWGEVDTVLSSNSTGLSISFPRISPDGRYLMFCMSDYGYFTIQHSNTDLYMMNLKTKSYHKLSVNSDQADSYHCWSTNGHWFVFASKRMDGLYSRLFISYVDEKGQTYKPLVIPQKDPLYYDNFLKNYNIPELIIDKAQVSAFDLRDKAFTKALPVTFDAQVDVDALSGASMLKKK